MTRHWTLGEPLGPTDADLGWCEDCTDDECDGDHDDLALGEWLATQRTGDDE